MLASSIQILATVLSPFTIAGEGIRELAQLVLLQNMIGPAAAIVSAALGFWAAEALTLAGGVFWWIATWLCRSVIVTEYGIIHDVTCISRAVSWSQITDYFAAEDDGRAYMVFFYENDDGERCRMNLPVPESQRAPFEQLISRKLDPRFRCTMREPYDEEALDE